MSMTVRRVRVDDVRLVQRLRLEALADAPEAFARTLAEEQVQPDRFWQERVARNAAGQESVAFIALDGEEPCGIVAGVLEADDPTEAVLVSMWVAPGQRQRGAGRLLVEAVRDWAIARGAERLGLCVSQRNTAARRLYLRMGFRPTGLSQPLRARSTVLVDEMTLSLGSPADVGETPPA